MSIDPSDLEHIYKPSSGPSNVFEENEFYSFLLNKIIVIPQARLPILELFGEKFGPFYPSQPIEIPIWVAQEFDRHGWIRIHEVPSWLYHIQEIIQLEKENPTLQLLPFQYLTIGKWIIDHFKRYDSSGTESSKFQLLLRDLEDIRSAKLYGIPTHNILKGIVDYTDAIGFGNIDQTELNNMRSMIQDTLLTLSDFDPKE